MSTSWKTSLCRGDIKVLELVAGLRSDWHIGALFSSLVRAHVLALPRAARSENTDHVEKTLVDQYKFSPCLRFYCLLINFWETVLGGRKHIFILECSVMTDTDVQNRLKLAWWVLPTAEASSPAAWGQSAWDGVAFTPRPLWCEENLNCHVKRVHLAH